MANYISKHTGKQIDAAVDAFLAGGGTGSVEVDTTLTQAGKAADAKATGDRLTALSEEIAGQTAPESFGAKGDGVTDDAAAITQALASEKHVVFDKSKTYAVGSTITIPANAEVNFNGAAIKPLGNHDVIQMKPGAHLENVVVRCSDVSGWDSAAIVFYGGDMYDQTNPTRISNVKLYCNTSSSMGSTTQGVGIKLYGDKFGDTVSGLTVDEVMTLGFGVGILIVGVGRDVDNPTGGLVFIGANKFRGYWSHMDNIAIKILGNMPNDHMTNNIFTDLQIEPNKNSAYGIYCDGFTNYFEGELYDYFTAKAIYFSEHSGRNVVKTTDAQVHRPNFLQDFGNANVVTNFYDENLNLIPNSVFLPKMIGNQDDCLAFIDKRADCVLESLDGDPYYGSLSNVFDPSSYRTLCYRTINPDKNNRRAIITINCRSTIGRLANFYLQFATPPKDVKITFYNAEEATVVYDTDDNVNRVVSVCSPYKYGQSHEYSVGKIVIELGGFNTVHTIGADTFGEWELVRIVGADSYKRGESLLWRDGGKMYGDIRFGQNLGPVLTDANGKLYRLTVSTDGTLGTSEVQEEEEEAPEVAALIPTMASGASWFSADAAGIEPSAVTAVTFNASYEPTGNEDASWACDEDGNGNIMAYRTGTEIVITPTTGSEKIRLNLDSQWMFANKGAYANFAALASVSGTEMLIANVGTNMSNVCNGNAVIVNPISVPDGVDSISYAFSGCYKLTAPPVLPDSVVSMQSAFGDCIAMLSLPEIPKSAVNLNYAFQNCYRATNVPSVIPATVNAMTATFRLCTKIAGTLEVNAVRMTYDKCFETAGRDTDGIVLTGTYDDLAGLAATAGENGKVTVATA